MAEQFFGRKKEIRIQGVTTTLYIAIAHPGNNFSVEAFVFLGPPFHKHPGIATIISDRINGRTGYDYHCKQTMTLNKSGISFAIVENKRGKMTDTFATDILSLLAKELSTITKAEVLAGQGIEEAPTIIHQSMIQDPTLKREFGERFAKIEAAVRKTPFQRMAPSERIGIVGDAETQATPKKQEPIKQVKIPGMRTWEASIPLKAMGGQKAKARINVFERGEKAMVRILPPKQEEQLLLEGEQAVNRSLQMAVASARRIDRTAFSNIRIEGIREQSQAGQPDKFHYYIILDPLLKGQRDFPPAKEFASDVFFHLEKAMSGITAEEASMQFDENQVILNLDAEFLAKEVAAKRKLMSVSDSVLLDRNVALCERLGLSAEIEERGVYDEGLEDTLADSLEDTLEDSQLQEDTPGKKSRWGLAAALGTLVVGAAVGAFGWLGLGGGSNRPSTPDTDPVPQNPTGGSDTSPSDSTSPPTPDPEAQRHAEREAARRAAEEERRRSLDTEATVYLNGGGEEGNGIVYIPKTETRTIYIVDSGGDTTLSSGGVGPIVRGDGDRLVFDATDQEATIVTEGNNTRVTIPYADGSRINFVLVGNARFETYISTQPNNGATVTPSRANSNLERALTHSKEECIRVQGLLNSGQEQRRASVSADISAARTAGDIEAHLRGTGHRGRPEFAPGQSRER